MPKKARRKKSRPAIPIEVRRRLLHSVLRQTFKGIANDAEAIRLGEDLLEYGRRVIAGANNVANPDDVITIYPTHGTTRLLNAIDAHIESTKERDADVVNRLIACLGSQAAFGSQPQ